MRKITDPAATRKTLVEKIKTLVESGLVARNIEKGIYNYTIEDATRKHLVKKWENVHFVEIYLTRFRTIFNNLRLSPYLREQLEKKQNQIAS